MKTFLVLSVFALFIFWPWLIGIVDIAAYAVTGKQLTLLPWNTGRGAILLLWPIACTMIFALIADVVS